MWLSSRIGAKPLGAMCRRIATSVEAGLDILSILDRESKNGSSTHQRIISEIRKDIAKGETFAEAVLARGNYFPRQFQLMIDVGEKTGRLELVLYKLAEYYERLNRLKGIFLAAIIWPGIQFVIALGVVGLVIWIPSWLGLGDTDILGFGLVGTRGLLIYVALIVGAAVLLGMLFGAVRRGFLARQVSELLMRTPGIGPAFRTMAQLRFSRSLGLAIESGMDAWNSVGLAFQSAEAPYFAQHADRCKKEVRNGSEIHATLRDVGVFDQGMIDAVQIGEDTGKLAESLEVHSKQLDDKVDTAFQGLAILAGVAVWICIGLFIIFMIFRLASFYFGMINEALNGF
ncbi:MAG: type II secretion system F family protein [Planctomycetales bacterium]|nr:type II secretion system F family protein [Planctomycetales bacterium]